VGLRRTSLDGSQTIWALHHFGSEAVTIPWDSLVGADLKPMVDLLSHQTFARSEELVMEPRTARWLTPA